MTVSRNSPSHHLPNLLVLGCLHLCICFAVELKLLASKTKDNGEFFETVAETDNVLCI